MRNEIRSLLLTACRRMRFTGQVPPEPFEFTVSVIVNEGCEYVTNGFEFCSFGCSLGWAS